MENEINDVTVEESNVRRFQGTEFFAYCSASGPEAGWHLFRDEEDGEETTMCKIDTPERLKAAILLFNLNG